MASRSLIAFRRQGAWSRLAGYGAMALIVLIVGLPLFWMASGAVKTTKQIYTFPPIWIPESPRWENFRDAWNAAPFGRFYINSIVTTFFGTGLELVNATLSAYALAFLRFPKKNLVFILLLIALMVPSQVVIIPNYVFLGRTMYETFGGTWLTDLFFDLTGQSWINTYQGIILPGVSVAYGTFLIRQAFLGMPREVLEAARVDGCNHLRLLWDVVIPMGRPVIVTFGLISLVAKWNDYLWPLVVTNTQDMRTLTVGITYLFDREGNTDWGVVMAATIFVILPLLVVYLWAQRHIIEGITAGATKG